MLAETWIRYIFYKLNVIVYIHHFENKEQWTLKVTNVTKKVISVFFFFAFQKLKLKICI